jgi:predicted PurR-regulated permease PerM
MPQTNDQRSRTGLPWAALRRLRGLLLGAVVVGLVYVLRGIAQLFVVAALLAYLLNPLVRRLQRRMSRTQATLIVFGLGLAGAVGAGILLVPVVQQQVQDVSTAVDLSRVSGAVERVDARLNAVSDALGGGEVRFEERIDRGVRAWTTSVVTVATGLVGYATNVVLVPFIALFLLRDGPRLKRGLIRFVPNRYFEFSLQALHKIDIQLGNYFRGLVLEVAIVTALSISVLWGLEVPAFVLVGLLAGVTTVIPYAGSLIGGSVGVFLQLASTGSVLAAGLVLAAFLALQIADETLIQPLVFAQAVDLHPLEVLVAVWVAAQFFGVLGMVLAIPAVSTGKVVVSQGAALIQRYQFG